MVVLKRFLFCLLFTLGTADDFSSGADYLQTAIRDIVIKNSERNYLSLIENQARIVTQPPKRRVVTSSSVVFDGNRRFSGGDQSDYLQPPDPHPHQASHHVPSPPSAPSAQGGVPDAPSLTKGELAALYEAAVSAGHSVHMNAPGGHDSLPVQAALHEIRDTTAQIGQDGDSYYYYYYPLKSFLDGIPAQVTKPQHHVPKDHYKTPVLTSYNTHMHNVKVEPIPIHALADHPGKGGKAIEPLFMAISSFVGMAVMFVFSMVLLPRLTGGIKKVIKPKGPGGGGKAKFKHNNNNKNNNNNRNNNNNNRNNNKKKSRVMDLEAFDREDWPRSITDFIRVGGCTTCDDHSRLGPYQNVLSSFGGARSRN